jgi:hypothetical protein
LSDSGGVPILLWSHNCHGRSTLVTVLHLPCIENGPTLLNKIPCIWILDQWKNSHPPSPRESRPPHRLDFPRLYLGPAFEFVSFGIRTRFVELIAKIAKIAKKRLLKLSEPVPFASITDQDEVSLVVDAAEREI